MKQTVISAKVPANKEKGTPEVSGQVTIAMPETIEEAVKAYGAEAVLSNAIGNWTLSIQAAIRSAIKRNEPTESYQTRISQAKMGVTLRSPAVDPHQAFLAMFQNSDPAKQAELIKQLQEKAAKLKKA